jgi:4-diphosphocytidyl-2-C-methyl-D-erythritol kinase
MVRDHPGAEDSLRLTARAKLNLYLHIVGRRADGYHLIESLIAFTGFGDELALAPADKVSLRLEGPFAGELGETPPKDNLVLRAAQLLADWAAARGIKTSGARLTLEKQLPVASGIGGGSADAAATFKGLAALWRLPIDNAALRAMAAGLGADVPACVEGKAAMMEGIGERITPVGRLPPAPVVLVNPRIPLATPAVYRLFREECEIAPGPRRKPKGLWTDTRALIEELEGTENDLEPVAITLCPQIGHVLAALNKAGAGLARMSGSGATCFGLFADHATAAQAAARLRAASPDWWIAESALA